MLHYCFEHDILDAQILVYKLQKIKLFKKIRALFVHTVLTCREHVFGPNGSNRKQTGPLHPLVRDFF